MAQLDSSSYFDALAVSMKEHNEKLSESVTQLKAYYQKQLWHEFSSTVVQLMLEPAFRVAAYDIHDILIVPVRSSIDGSVYVRLLFHACAALASSGENDSLDRVNSLLDSAIASLLSNGHNQCVSAVHCLKALMLMAHGPSLEAKSLLHRAADAIAETPVHEILPVLQALYYRAQLRLCELMCDYDGFYHAAFAFLRYGATAGLEPRGDELGAVAYKTAVAALLARKVYNFGELLNTATLIDALEADETNRWAIDLIRTCSRGDVTAFETFVKGHGSLLESMPDLRTAVQQGSLGKKVRLMSLLHLIFHTPADMRVIGFDAISQRCSVSSSEVEPLLLTAMAQRLIEGTIDELNSSVEVTWVLPRVLSKAEIADLAKNIATWRAVVKQTAAHVGKLSAKIGK